MALKGDLHQPVGGGAELAGEVGGFGNRAGEWFLDEHRNAAARERHDVAGVVLGARRDDHGVDAAAVAMRPASKRSRDPREVGRAERGRRTRAASGSTAADRPSPRSRCARRGAADQVLEMHAAHAAGAEDAETRPRRIG